MAKSKKSVEEIDASDLQRIRDLFEYNFTKWDPIYKEGDTDMKYRAGDPWDPKEKTARDDAGRPTVTFDELGQYRNQAVNDVRANPVSAKFTPDGDGANDETARFYEDLDREIDYRSGAQLAYTNAFEGAIDRSYGYIRLATDYEHPKSFQQSISVHALENPSAWYPDADGKRPDGKDWRNGDFIERYSRDEFKRTFPGASYKDFSREQISALGKSGGSWGTEDSVQVSQHWEIEMREGKLTQWEIQPTMRNPMPRLVEIIDGEGRKPRNARFVQSRVTEVPYVRSCFTNGLEILEKGGQKWHPFAGDWIPFVPCFGAILWRDKGSGAEREILSMIRLARSPFMAYCYAITSLVEAIGMITKNPYVAYEGMLDAAQMNEIAKSLHQPVAVLLSKPFLKDHPELGLLPMLQKNPLSQDISSYVGLAEVCRRAIQAAMGWTPLPTQAQKQNEKSGIALQRIEESGQKGSFHFKDHYYLMIKRGAEIKENLIDRIYDTPRDIVTRAVDNEPQRWRINDPKAQGDKTLKSIKGRHAVTIDIGPEFSSQREASDAMIDNLIGSPIMGMIDPQKRDKIIALAVRARNMGPMGTKIADVISPPENKDGQPNVAEMQAALQQGAQIAQAQAQRIQELESGLAAKQLEVQSREKVAEQSDRTKTDIANMQADQKMAEAELRAQTDLRLQSMEDEIARMKIAADAVKQRRQESHDHDLAQRGSDAAAAQSEREHGHTMESQSQSESAAERQADKAAAMKKDSD